MSWKEVKPMDEKVKFIADFLRGDMPFKTLCGLYEISRKTGYKWVQRYRKAGVDGLNDQSRRPHLSSATPMRCVRLFWSYVSTKEMCWGQRKSRHCYAAALTKR